MTAAPEPFLAYARRAAARLPAAERDNTVAELLDHLITDYERHLYRGTGSAAATAAVLARFGPADQVAAGYLREERRWRRHRLAASACAAAIVLTAIWATLLMLAPPASRWPLRPQPAGVAATGMVMLAAAAITVITVTTSRLLTSPSRAWAAHPAADALMPVLYRAALASLVLGTASAGILTGWRAVAAGQSWMAIALPCAAGISVTTLTRLTARWRDCPASSKLPAHEPER